MASGMITAGLFIRSGKRLVEIVNRQLTERFEARRARQRVSGSRHRPGPTRQRAIVGAFLTAAPDGESGALLEAPTPDVVVRFDGTEVSG